MTDFDTGASWARQFQEDIARSVDRAIDLAMPPCAGCGHTFVAHHDRPSWELPVEQMRCRDCPEGICDASQVAGSR